MLGSSQTKADSGQRVGSAMEMNFDPNHKAPTPYLLFKAHFFFFFAELTLHPFSTLHLPPTFQALTFDLS